MDLIQLANKLKALEEELEKLNQERKALSTSGSCTIPITITADKRILSVVYWDYQDYAFKVNRGREMILLGIIKVYE